MACHPVSPCLKIDEKTDNGNSGTQKEKEVTESWNIRRNELEDRQTKMKRPLSNPTEEATSGGENGGTLSQQPESEMIKTGRICVLLSGSVTRQETCSESMTEAGTGQMLNIERDIQDTINGNSWKGRGHRDATLLNEKGLTNRIGGVQLLGFSKHTSLERNLKLLSTTGIFDYSTEEEKIGERQEKNFEYRVHSPEIKEAECPPGSENKGISVGCHAVSPKKISISSERADHKVSHCQAENSQDVQHLTEYSLVQCETKLVLGDNTADNLQRSTEDGIEFDTSSDNKMEPELYVCSDVQLGEKQCHTEYREASELPGRHTESGERGRDRDESLMPPVNSDECTDTGKYMMGLICKNTVSCLLGFF